MSKLITFFLLLIVTFSGLGAINKGGGGMTATTMTANITAAATTVNVTSTQNFLDEDNIYIGSEEIHYTAITAVSFTGCTRGYNGSTAVVHGAGSYVYAEGSEAINASIGFNVTNIVDSWGMASIIAIPVAFMIFTIPKGFVACTQLFSGDLAFISYIFLAVMIGIMISIALRIRSSRSV
jgi:hypothetical protein